MAAPICSRLESCVQIYEPRLQGCLVILPCQTIYAACSVLLRLRTRAEAIRMLTCRRSLLVPVSTYHANGSNESYWIRVFVVLPKWKRKGLKRLKT